MEGQGAVLAKRLATLLSGLLECMCFAGVIFGWASLVFVLKDMHYFEELCVPAANGTGNGTQGPDSLLGCGWERTSPPDCYCPASQVCMCDSLGLITKPDRSRPSMCLCVCCTHWCSLTRGACVPPAATALILFPAMCLLSVGGILFILTNMQVGNLFGKHRSTIITLYNGAFDSSSAIFLLVKVNLGSASRGLPAMFLFLSACSIWHLTRTFFLMPRWHIPYPLPSGYTYGLRCERQGCSSHLHEEQNQATHVWSQAREMLMPEKPSRAMAGPGHGEQQPAKSFRACVFSKLFFWHLMWLSVMQLRHYLFIGTPNPLTVKEQAEGRVAEVSTYTNAFAFTQLCGVLCAPWNGLILDRHKRGKTKEGSAKGAVDPLADLRSCVLSLAVTALQCVAFSVCASVPVLPVQYVTFILQVLSRSFLYGGNAAFLAIAFPLEHFGKLYGLVMGLSAVVSLLQYPCFALVKGPLGDDPFYVNIGLNIVILLAFVSPLVVLRECRRRAKEQDEPRA
uniref:Solute carrier family 43 member 3 n=1 Tax=Pelodiscus sinensis TaxID=13735 RepID=K7FFV2_PELSI